MKIQHLNGRMALAIMILLISFSSCQQSRHTNKSAAFQKRKYTKGYHVNARVPNLFEAEAKRPSPAHSPGDDLPKLIGETASAVSDIPTEIIESGDLSASTSIGQADLAIESPLQRATRMSSTEKAAVNERAKGKAFWNKKRQLKDVDYVQNYDVRVVPGLAIAGFVAGILCIFVAALPLGLLALIFGGISLGKINRSPQLYKGRGFAIVALILGILGVVFGLLYIAAAAAI